MKLLIVGNGGREETMRWHAEEFGHKAKTIKYTTINDMVNEAKRGDYDLTAIGPEQPLVDEDGIAERFEQEGLLSFAPTKEAAMNSEGSKIKAKDLMSRMGIPTAEYRVADNLDMARQFVKEICYLNGSKDEGCVVKADGLALGKGVIVCNNETEAYEAINTLMIDPKNKFKGAGKRLVIEERLEGEEASFIAITDAKTIRAMDGSQDNKAAYTTELDRIAFSIASGIPLEKLKKIGPNTGGMAAYSPAGVVTNEIYDQVMEETMWPFVRGMEALGCPYKGVIYAGLMIKDGKHKVLEFNARFGDPETQPLFMRLKSDVTTAMKHAAEGTLDEVPEFEWDPRTAVCIVMASGGYPGTPDKGYEITGIDAARAMKDVKIFEAAVDKSSGTHINNGGRVLGVGALGDDLRAALDTAYGAANLIAWKNEYHITTVGGIEVPR